MEDSTRKYTNGEVTVVWKPTLCIHSAVCFNGLPDVFNPRNRPWITLEGTETERIIAQIKKCPSGALSFTQESKNEPETEAKNQTHAEIIENGPLKIAGPVIVKKSDGTEETHEKAAFFCRCGGSGNKPYCDGSHKRNGFAG
jgi:uncharacterized Fe-S cluster protein YjdI